MDPVAEIRRLYYTTKRATIAGDLTRAIELARSMKDDTERERVAVYLDGLSQMRSEWQEAAGPAGKPPTPKGTGRRRSVRKPSGD